MNQPLEPREAAPARPVVHPGDLVQITAKDSQFHGCFGLVREKYGWGLAVDFLAVTETTGRIGVSQQRFKEDAVAVIGAAVMMPPDVAAARRASIETAQLLEQEKG